MKSKLQMQIRWMARVLILALLIGPTTSGGRVYAAEPSIAGEWEITFEVVNGEMKAFWIGRIWKYTDGVGEITAQRRVDITNDCEVFGEPVFNEANVTLDGKDDYIACKIPDYASIFLTMAPELLKCRCYYEGPPYAAADVQPNYAAEAQPIVYHDRIFLEIQRDSKNLRLPVVKTMFGGKSRGVERLGVSGGVGVARLTLQFLNDEIESWESNLFNAWQNDGFQIWAGYDVARYVQNTTETGFAKFLADSGLWDDVQPEHTNGFFMWESEAATKYAAQEMPSGFGLAGNTFIYIGHNPEAGTYFNGNVSAVAVDPGCRGH